MAIDVVNFYANAMLTVRAHLDSGTVLKKDMKAAVDQAALDLIVDTR